MNQTPITQVTKKPWSTPELIVLVRSRPEEAVLTDCFNFGPSVPTRPFTGKPQLTRAGCAFSGLYVESASLWFKSRRGRGLACLTNTWKSQ